MVRKIVVLMYGLHDECLYVKSLLENAEYFSSRECEYTSVETYEMFKEQLAEIKPTLVIVLKNGAIGMEAVYLSKHRFPLTTVFWFTNDSDFVMESHRLNCGYFGTKPVTAEHLNNAIRRCIHLGISLDAR